MAKPTVARIRPGPVRISGIMHCEEPRAAMQFAVTATASLRSRPPLARMPSVPRTGARWPCIIPVR